MKDDIVVIQRRLHTQDISGEATDFLHENYVYLNLPMKYEPMTREQYLSLPLEDRLRFWINLPKGANLDPSWVAPSCSIVNTWDDFVREICQDALDKIEFYRKRAGAVSDDDGRFDIGKMKEGKRR